MNIANISVPAIDGYPLACSLYEPEAPLPRKPGLVISGATAVSRGYYDGFAQFLCERGFTVLTFDYRGIGGSLHGDIRAVKASMRDWGQSDLAGVLNAASERCPSSKLLVVGHSAGGQFLGLCPNNDLAGALLAVASQSGYWRFWGRPRRYLLAALWYGVMPALTRAASYFPAKKLGLGEDLPAGVAMEWARWCRNRDFIVDEKGKPLREHFQKFQGAICAYSFADDTMAPPAAVDSLMRFYCSAAVERRHVRPLDIGARKIGHFGFFRDKFKDSLWIDGLQWLLRH